uniref:Phosphatidylserine decarboxylase n=1 Tax=Candidatus Kentrum sp. FM TaxID=2126340 RepID=A0A450VZS1_9GAMM|nr:MAG: phosphatidylserine decarboxylase [Candidatus Kentron sp. FM]VFJ67964.1 MAG: phosphatidylserine decarboxylase [Candidatus Kentron sp. FM]VFK10308.1 MAG: phosphatidylserine decarboxylase [Candidatus Kentron sp. FM]
MTNQIKVLGTDALIERKTVDLASIVFLYKTKLGRLILNTILVREWFGSLHAIFYKSRLSISKIKPFIQEYSIDTEEFDSTEYRSFNHFFIRTFKPGRREFVKESSVMPAFCEAFYLGWQSVSLYQPTYVKGKPYTVEQLFQDRKKASLFIDGPLIIARLAPYHYHWFHFPDDGQILDHYHIPGKLHSVDPIAIGQKPDILWTNKRDITILETENFGKIAYIEVGALTVGKIYQCNKTGEHFSRGQKKGYFSFGGSTVMVIGQNGIWSPCDEIIEHTKMGIECSALLGQAIAGRNGD